ncbi:MAG: Smr/MutS family protein [Woeseiaceae bacterium]|nr:Smr/MutS family protein [Woeseiaceae bacterium]
MARDHMTDDDVQLFRRLVGDATPLKTEPRAPALRRRPKPRARFARADEARVLDESLAADIEAIEHANGDSLRFKRPSVGRRTMQKLSRGRFAIQAEIDLHGMTIAEAEPRLREFIELAVLRRHLCVRVVHGKGRGSGHRGPVLKQAVNRWLRRWKNVLAFVSARQVDGGTGAVYVLLDRD